MKHSLLLAVLLLVTGCNDKPWHVCRFHVGEVVHHVDSGAPGRVLEAYGLPDRCDYEVRFGHEPQVYMHEFELRAD